MKLQVKAPFSRLWVLFLLAGLSLFTISSFSFAAAPKIGESYGGGVVFYVDGTGQHGLIAARVDMTGHAYRKGEGFFTWYDAHNGANAFVEGYSDWVLPNKEQLHQLYLNRSAVGGFAETVYWSASEGDADNAWAENFSTGEQLVGKKMNGSRVRAVRAF